MKKVLCSLVVLGAAMGMQTEVKAHGNNPAVMTERDLVLMTYVHLLIPDVWDGLMEVATPLMECIEGALFTCGEGEVCWVCVVNHEVCSFLCRNKDGSCPSPQPCGLPPPDIG